MKRLITLENNTLLQQFEKDLLTEIEKETPQKVKKSVLETILNFSKSLIVKPSQSVKGERIEVVLN